VAKDRNNVSEYEVMEAKIQSTMLGVEDHGIFTFVIELNYGGAGQCAGHFALDAYNEKKDYRPGWVGAIPMIRRLLEVVGVSSWEGLVGKKVRVRCKYDRVKAIGNIKNNEWLDFSMFATHISNGEGE